MAATVDTALSRSAALEIELVIGEVLERRAVRVSITSALLAALRVVEISPIADARAPMYAPSAAGSD